LRLNKILFIGLGGAGQRHLRIFNQLVPSEVIFSAYRKTGLTPLLHEDFSVDASNTVEDAYKLITFNNLEAAFNEQPDLTVISTPTSFHRESMMMAVEAGSAVFVEKPWAENLDGFQIFSDAVLTRQVPFLISFQRRFHPQMIQTHKALQDGLVGRPMSASFKVYTNVPEWHPYEDWRRLYAVRADMGGGVLLTETHEIDLVNWFFGLPDAVFCTGGNRSLEKLSIEDTAQMILLYTDFSVQITLCFMHKKKSRSFHIAGTSGDIAWDETTNKLTITSSSQSFDLGLDPLFSGEKMFLDQARYFLNNWSINDTKDSLSAAAGSLAIVEAAKRSMYSGKLELVDQHFADESRS